MKEINSDRLIRVILSNGRPSLIRTYMLLTLGKISVSRFIGYELLTGLLGALPGGIGYYLRKVFYPAFFKKAGKGLIIGRNVVIRSPGKISFGDNVIIDDNCLVDARGAGSEGIVIGDNVILNRNTMIQSKEGAIRIGKCTTIGCNSVIISIDGVEIGDGAMLAGGCYISSGIYHFENIDQSITDQGIYSKGPITVGNQSWISTRVTILDGVTIGSGAVIGAGAVVAKDIPDYAVAVGVPAVVTRIRGQILKNGSEGKL
ncbi:MAG: acyltransferase [Desulfobacterales bacterium]|nr:acyltransferase [Desulfobacterales bacterium]MDD4072954.1 acyltransferase [Desulfobacterales bacterium]MDD4392773.1 acyltransferase [Desulfobacterales bacterium]